MEINIESLELFEYDYKIFLEYLSKETNYYNKVSSLNQFENKIYSIIISSEQLNIDEVYKIENPILNIIYIIYEGINLTFIPCVLIYLLIGIIVRYFTDIIIKDIKLIPTKVQYILEYIYLSLSEVIMEQLENHIKKYFPYLIFLFLIIFLFNIIGLIPYNYTVTAQIAITFSLSLGIFFSLIIIGILFKGINFIFYFIPGGAPFLLKPYIFIIELVSFISKGFSLGIRLSANMFAGHVLLSIISKGIIYFLFLNIFIVNIFSILPFIFLILLLGLESVIAFLQSYVFVILSSIYIKDVSTLETH